MPVAGNKPVYSIAYEARDNNENVENPPESSHILKYLKGSPRSVIIPAIPEINDCILIITRKNGTRRNRHSLFGLQGDKLKKTPFVMAPDKPDYSAAESATTVVEDNMLHYKLTSGNGRC